MFFTDEMNIVHGRFLRISDIKILVDESILFFVSKSFNGGNDGKKTRRNHQSKPPADEEYLSISHSRVHETSASRRNRNPRMNVVNFFETFLERNRSGTCRSDQDRRTSELHRHRMSGPWKGDLRDESWNEGTPKGRPIVELRPIETQSHNRSESAKCGPRTGHSTPTLYEHAIGCKRTNDGTQNGVGTVLCFSVTVSLRNRYAACMPSCNCVNKQKK